MRPVHVIGGGLAGSECAYQLARRGVPVVLWEMRPERSTPVHRTAELAELVCSNSLRSDDPEHAAGVLKREMEAFSSLVIASARRTAVPAGSALAVDRERFAALVTETLAATPGVEIRRAEAAAIPEGDVVIATGPLTSASLTERLRETLGSEHLYFYDAIAPIVDAETLDESKLFRGSRWDDGDDYLNAPLDREQYVAFREALVCAEEIDAHPFERELFFEGCLPVEELARRGEDTLRFGPMKPIGLRRPDGTRPYAVVQLRQENLARTYYNLVGFQSRLRWSEQKRLLRTLPGLERAEFVRLGQVHRNTFVNAPLHLDRWYRLRTLERVRLAGQLTGVEGYLESAATGLLCGLYVALERERGSLPEPLPATTALGALARHLTESGPTRFQPSNINWGLVLPLDETVAKRERRAALARRARAALERWIAAYPAATYALPTPTPTSAALAAEH